MNFGICYFNILNACPGVLKNKFRRHLFRDIRILVIFARHNNAAEKACTVDTGININAADGMSVAVKRSAERTFLCTDRRPLVSR